jgi:hypothetical protein
MKMCLATGVIDLRAGTPGTRHAGRVTVSAARRTGTGRLRLGVPAIALVGLVSAAALAGGSGRAAAAPARGTAAMTAGDIYEVAGTGTLGFSGDGGPATKAELYNPGDMAMEPDGNLLIADQGNERIRVVDRALNP